MVSSCNLREHRRWREEWNKCEGGRHVGSAYALLHTYSRDEEQKWSDNHDPPLAPRRLTRHPLRQRSPPRSLPPSPDWTLVTWLLLAEICHLQRGAAEYVGDRWCLRRWQELTATRSWLTW